jgi:adenylate cyclase
MRCVSLGDRQLKNLDVMRVHRIEPVDAPIALQLSPFAVDNPSGAVEDASIAVLPFDNQSTELTDALLCDGVTTDVIERLSRFRELSVIARHSAFHCRALARAPSEVGQVLGARYVAVGTVRRAGVRLRVTAQLLEAESSRVLWSDRFDGNVVDVFDFQDEVADMIAARLATHVSEAERRRIINSRAPVVGAYGLVLRGEDLMIRFREESNSHARHLFGEAASLDPEYARVYAGLSHALSQCWLQRWGNDSSSTLSDAVSLAREAISRDGMDARGYAELGYAYLYQKRHQESLAAYERAVELNPNDADVLAYMADTLGAIGQSERAVSLLERATRLNPYHPDWYLWQLGDVLFDLGRYDETIAALGRMRDPTGTHRLMAASHALLGNLPDARRHADEVLREHPDFSLERWREVPPDTNNETVERYFEGLRLAGLK